MQFAPRHHRPHITNPPTVLNVGGFFISILQCRLRPATRFNTCSSGLPFFVQPQNRYSSLPTTNLATEGDWCPFPGDCRYEICSLGAVRNAQTGHVLRPWLAGYGYWYVQLGAKGIKTGIHRLVALTFLGSPPTPLHEVAHNDGDRNNNALTNLRWATHAENVADSFRHGTARVPVFRGQDHPRTTLTDSAVREIRRRHTGRRGEQIQLAREFGVSRYVIHHIVRGETWQHLN